MRSYFMPLLAIFLQKLNFYNSQPFIFRSNGRTNFIFDSGKIWGCKFFKKWKLEKGGGKGGATNYVWVYTMTISKNVNLTSETATRASYHGINDRNQHSEMMPLPFAHPFVFRPPEQKSWIFPIFEAGILCSWASRDFCPPFGIFGKFKISSTIYVFIIFPQNALFSLYKPIS